MVLLNLLGLTKVSLLRYLTVALLVFLNVAVYSPRNILAQPSQDPLQPASLQDSRQISFSGYDWIVKSGSNRGPGPNNWSDSTDSVWVDSLGQLHLHVTYRNGQWYAAETYMTQSLGYGRYVFYVGSRVDRLDKNVVAGMFVYQDDSNEIDMEFSAWGGLATNSQYAVQPPPYNDQNLHRFNMSLNGDYSTHRFVWTSNSISFRSLHGHYSEPPDNNYVIAQWQYGGSHILQPGAERTHINLYLNGGTPPSDGKEAELIVTRFEFIPLKIPNVVNHLIENPPYGEASQSCGTLGNTTGIVYLNFTCASRPDTGELLAYAEVELDASGLNLHTAKATVVSLAQIGDGFHVVHDSWYRVSMYFELNGIVLNIGNACCTGSLRFNGFTQVSATLTTTEGKTLWTSGNVTVDERHIECGAPQGEAFCIEGSVPFGVHIVHSLNSPWLHLDEGKYRWNAQLTLEAGGIAVWSATGGMSLMYATVTCNECNPRVLNGEGKLVQVVVDDACTDYVPPITTSSLSGIARANGWYRSPLSVTLGAADGPSSIDCLSPYGVNSTYYRVDGGPWSNYFGPFNITGDGRHKLEFYSTDKAGNIEEQKAVDILIDSSPPAGVLHINDDVAYTSTRFVSLVASATDGTQGSGGIQMVFRNSEGTYSDWMPYSTGLIPWSLTSGDGDKGVCVQFKDAAGNIDTEYCRHIFLDTTPPPTPNPKAQVIPRNSTVTFSWSLSADAGSGVAGYVWRVDAGNEMFTTATSVNLPSLVGERHAFYVRAEDNAGLISSWGSVPFGVNAPSTPISLLASVLNSSPAWILIPGAFVAGVLAVIAYREKGTARLSRRS